MGLISYNLNKRFNIDSLKQKLLSHPKIKGSNLVPVVSSNKSFNWDKSTSWPKNINSNKKNFSYISL